MSKTQKRLQLAWTSADAGQNERVAVIVSAIGQHFKAKKSAFDLDELFRSTHCQPADLSLATKIYYSRLLLKHWEKGTPDERRRKMLEFAAKKLRLPANDVRKWNDVIAATYFGACLAEALKDGVVSDLEIQKLSLISGFADQPAKTFLRQHLYDEGVGFLRGVFADAATTGVLEPRLWANLDQSAQLIGLTSHELLVAVSPLAQTFAEHTLADAKSDGHLSGSEEAYLNWLLKTFEYSAEFEAYVRQEMATLRDRALAATGNLGSVNVPHSIKLQAGEIPYFFQKSTLRLAKELKAGTRYDDHAGHLLLTDNRLVFQSLTKPLNISYRTIVGWESAPDRITVSVADKPPMKFYFPGGQALSSERFDALIRLHSQPLQREHDGGLDTYVPREVRERTWKRFGGRCAECRGTEYLEFAHIVSVFQGGTNSDQNIQILCQRCKATKSDNVESM